MAQQWFSPRVSISIGDPVAPPWTEAADPRTVLRVPRRRTAYPALRRRQPRAPATIPVALAEAMIELKRVDADAPSPGAVARSQYRMRLPDGPQQMSVVFLPRGKSP